MIMARRHSEIFVLLVLDTYFNNDILEHRRYWFAEKLLKLLIINIWKYTKYLWKLYGLLEKTIDIFFDYFHLFFLVQLKSFFHLHFTSLHPPLFTF